MIINTANMKDLRTSYNGAFREGVAKAKPDWELIATKSPSTTDTEHYAWLGDFPRITEWVDDRAIRDMAAYDYTIKNKQFEGTVGVKATVIKDDKYGVYKPRMSQMGFASANFPSELVYELLATALTALCYDKTPMVNANHPWVPGRNSNLQVAAGGDANGPTWFLLDTAQFLKPLIYQEREKFRFAARENPEDINVFMKNLFLYGVDGRCNAGFGFWQQMLGSTAPLTQPYLDAAIAQMMGMVSDQKRPLMIKPTLLVVGPSLRGAANEAVKVARLAGGADNPNHNVVDILITPYLT